MSTTPMTASHGLADRTNRHPRDVAFRIRDQVSEGEVEQVMEQLPADLRDLWRPVV